MNHRESELRRFSLKIYYWNVYQGGAMRVSKWGNSLAVRYHSQLILAPALETAPPDSRTPLSGIYLARFQ